MISLLSPLFIPMKWSCHRLQKNFSRQHYASRKNSEVTSSSSLLVITPCSPKALPSQGFLIAERLREAGLRTGILTKAETGWGRLLDVILRGFLLASRYDVMLVNIYGERAFIYESMAILYARFWKKRVIVLLHSGIMPEFVQRWPRWTRLMLHLPDLVLAPHGFLGDRLSPLGVRIDGLIPNFINLEKYNFRERTTLAPRFLYLRGMHPDYNPAMALRAFALIQRMRPDARLTMAGPEGQESTDCRSLARSLNLHNIQFIGLIPKDEIPAMADQHDIHLHTNRVENMPVSIIEMWACGLPIVGTNVGGMPYLVRHRLDGILVKSEDYQSMANNCLDLLSDSELAGTLSRHGRARAEELTWENIRPAWERALLLVPQAIGASFTSFPEGKSAKIERGEKVKL